MRTHKKFRQIEAPRAAAPAGMYDAGMHVIDLWAGRGLGDERSVTTAVDYYGRDGDELHMDPLTGASVASAWPSPIHTPRIQ